MTITKSCIIDAIDDLLAALPAWRIWLLLGWTDIRLRYRRTIIGPIWMTISMGVMIAGVGLVWSILFKVKVSEFFPYFSSGFIIWSLISVLVTESCAVFTERPALIKDQRLPLTYFGLRMVTRNTIVFFHNILIYFGVAVFFGVDFLTPFLAFSVLGLALLLLNGGWLSIVLGILGARFRDITQVVTSLMSVALTVTAGILSPSWIGIAILLAVSLGVDLRGADLVEVGRERSARVALDRVALVEDFPASGPAPSGVTSARVRTKGAHR